MKKKTPLTTVSTFLSALAIFSVNLAVADQENEYDNDGNNASYQNHAVYRIEMHNQTANQWFSPYLCALHNRRLRLFQVNRAATTGQATFSEDGYNGILAKELRENPNVYSVLETAPGLTPPGTSRVEHISGPSNARLTCIAMPVTTNDVLTVIQNVKTPKHHDRTQSYSSTEWDLGSEFNNYSAQFMPEDSINLVPEEPNNPVTISDNVVFGSVGRPAGVPSLLSPFTRAYVNSQGAIAEGTMSVFTQYVGSDDFPAELYGWAGSASRFLITRVE